MLPEVGMCRLFRIKKHVTPSLPESIAEDRGMAGKRERERGKRHMKHKTDMQLRSPSSLACTVLYSSHSHMLILSYPQYPPPETDATVYLIPVRLLPELLH